MEKRQLCSRFSQISHFLFQSRPHDCLHVISKAAWRRPRRNVTELKASCGAGGSVEVTQVMLGKGYRKKHHSCSSEAPSAFCTPSRHGTHIWNVETAVPGFLSLHIGARGVCERRPSDGTHTDKNLPSRKKQLMCSLDFNLAKASIC